MDAQKSAFEAAITCHERTKHHFHRYARSAGFMDWANQPNPFRFFRETRRVSLPLLFEDPPLPFDALFDTDRPEAAPLELRQVSGFLELSMGLSAWKAIGQNRWSLRINPSSGNLHPTELYLILPRLGGLDSGLYHYSPFYHALEERVCIPENLWSLFASHFGGPGFFAALTSIYWRESWKYGERAYRYCHHDVGHALAALAFAAKLWGWHLVALDTVGTRTLGSVLGIDRTNWLPNEADSPDLICWISSRAIATLPTDLPDSGIRLLADLRPVGIPERLSTRAVNWDLIYRTSEALEKPETSASPYEMPDQPDFPYLPSTMTAAGVIRRRRSAVGFDPQGRIGLEQLISILRPTLPSALSPPFDSRIGEPSISLVLFVHRVTGLPPGLYVWIRHPEHRRAIQNATRKEYDWETIHGEAPLYRLESGDFRETAARLSCHQAIAGDSAFSLGMLARFNDPLSRHPWQYPRLFWEAGMIGQCLYLAAEAHGVRGTGIGCYFDDPFHELLGISTNSWQSLYHFTIGHPMEDPRLQTLPAYSHLQKSES